MENYFFQSEGFNHPNCCKAFGMVHGTVNSITFVPAVCILFGISEEIQSVARNLQHSTKRVSTAVMPWSVVRSCVTAAVASLQQPLTINTRASFQKRCCFLTDTFSGLMQKSDDHVC